MPLQVHPHDGWTEIVLDNPPHNVLDPVLLESLSSTLSAQKERGGPLILLRAAGRHFSTGYPIGDIPEEIFHTDSAVRAATPFETVMRRLVEYPAPVVMAVQGGAWGGAVELLSCADVRVAAAGVKVALTPVRLGLIYSHTGLRRLARTLGSPLLREMVLTGLPVGADRLAACGFFSRVVAEKDLMEAAREIIGAMLRGGPEALRGTRRVLGVLEETETLGEDLLREIAELRHRSRLSEEFRVAREAFLNGGPPPFGVRS